jgi:xanthine/CO dehydrogenase XdhC/CoxF family maturation factor
MAELRQILELWRTARAQGEDVCLATVVRVEGSSYRKPGARMLMTGGGRRAGTISGGCLEAEVQKKAWWLTEKGATVQRYSSFFDDDSPMPYGLGCGGTVHLLLERGEAVDSTLNALAYGSEHRADIAIVSVIDTVEGEDTVGDEPAGTRLILADDGYIFPGGDGGVWVGLAEKAIRERRSFWTDNGSTAFVEYVAPPQALYIFGAGDDALPLADFADRLGWMVTVIDGRSHLARAERFPNAQNVRVSRTFADIEPQQRDAAVILTHSYEQDSAALRALLPRELTYVGLLGPRRRTERLLAEVAPEIGLDVNECLSQLHSPVGLDIGAKDPVSIALSIIAEIHAVMERRSARIGRPSAAHV